MHWKRKLETSPSTRYIFKYFGLLGLYENSQSLELGERVSTYNVPAGSRDHPCRQELAHLHQADV